MIIDILDEMKKCLKRYKQPKLPQQEINNWIAL